MGGDVIPTAVIVGPRWLGFLADLDAPDVRAVVHDPLALLDDEEAGQ